jgi:hypothetical protein
MARNKPNPLLASFAAQLKAEHRKQLDALTEFDLIALMLTVNEELHVGPGRAGRIMNAYLANKTEIAEAIIEDYGPSAHIGDKECAHTKATLAKRLRAIFSPEDWEKYCTLFPLLREFWGVEKTGKD